MDVVSDVGSVIARLGLLVLALGAIGVAIGWDWDELARALGTSAVLGCAELHGVADLPRRAIVVGRTGPSPGGPLRAPVSGSECVWYRVVLRNARNRGVYRSSEPFTVADSTGVVRVTPRLADRYLFEDDIHHDLPVALVEIVALDAGPHPDVRERLTRHGFHVSGHRRDVCEVVEYRIPPDRAITVLGRPRRTRSGLVLTTARGGCGVAGQSPDELRAGARYHAKDALSGGRHLVIGGAAVLVAGLLLQVPGWLAG